MSDTNDEQQQLFTSLSKILENASDQVAIEQFSSSLRNVAVVLVVLRDYLVGSGFSESWAENACWIIWDSFFGREAS